MRRSLALLVAVFTLAAPALADLPLEETFRDEASCDAVQGLARAELDEAERAVLSQAVLDGVTLSATRVTGPGNWECTLPQVWEAGAERWIALGACEAGGDFFPALLTVERTNDTLRLRLGDSADSVTMRACPLQAVPNDQTSTPTE